MSATDSTTLRLERTYEARAEEVFDAWTNPEVLRRWWTAYDAGTTPVADVDLRVGGSYRLGMEDPGTAGSRHTVRGTYREAGGRACGSWLRACSRARARRFERHCDGRRVRTTNDERLKTNDQEKERRSANG